MRHPPASRLRRTLAAAALTLALGGLEACADLSAALPERITPVPTLPRLPSVTPVTPSPTRPPTATPEPTATPLPLLATVAVAANVRAGPSVDFEVVGVVNPGATIRLLGRQNDWYQISADEVNGWMSNQVLEIDPEIAAAVPETAP